MNHPEFQEQCAFFEWLKIKYPEVYEISNASAAGEIRCSIQKAVRLKKMGVKAGWPDIFIAYPTTKYHGCFIEMKSKGGIISASQRNVGFMLRGYGYFWSAAKGLDDAIEKFEEYMCSNIKWA